FCRGLSGSCEAAITLADCGDAQAIVAVTRGGDTARRLSALRPHAPIIATTNHTETARRLALCWGVTPVVTEIGEDSDSAGRLVGGEPAARGLGPSGGAARLVHTNPPPTPPAPSRTGSQTHPSRAP